MSGVLAIDQSHHWDFKKFAPFVAIDVRHLFSHRPNKCQNWHDSLAIWPKKQPEHISCCGKHCIDRKVMNNIHKG